MIALKLQQFWYTIKKIFLQGLVLPMLFDPSDAPPPLGGGIATGWGDFKRGGVRYVYTKPCIGTAPLMHVQGGQNHGIPATTSVCVCVCVCV